jgi:hypothetical protein
MAKSTKKKYKPSTKGKLKPVVIISDGVNVSELNYSERNQYIEENYAPFITDAQMIFSIWNSGIEYNYKANREEVVNSIIEKYIDLADYTEATLPQETIYEIQDWNLVRRDIDPETDEVIGETELKLITSDNTYNFSYNGLVNLNWRVYYDEEFERYFYVITPHLGGDIRGNYGDAIILEGNDKDELFYRFYEGFISGGASIYLKFKDGSEIGFDSEQDSDVFYFRVSESFEPTGMALKYLNDFEKFDSWKGDEFLEETIDIYLARKGVAPKMMAGGSLNDETPMAYIQVLGYDEGKWFNITDYSDGQDVIDGIYDWMNDLNEEFGGNREEYEVTDYEGFGDDLYDEYMGANEFDEIIEAYEKYENSDFPVDVITSFKSDSGYSNNTLSEIIDRMDDNFLGKYESLSDFGYEMVNQGVYTPSDNDVYITDTDKIILAGEEADFIVDDMRFDDLLNIAVDVKSEYEDEKSELEDKITELESEIQDLTSLQESSDDDDEYETISQQIEEKELELDEVQLELDDIDNRFEDKAREEARDLFYDGVKDRLENDLTSWLSEHGYEDDLQNINFLSVDYEKIGEEISSDYLIVEYDGDLYFFHNYEKGGRIMASKRKPKYDFYIVESSTKKLVSGYSSKAEAIEQRKLLVKEYPSMRFEIYTLGNLEAKTNLDVYAKKDYVQLSTLDKIKKVSIDAYRYGEEKVGQANQFLKKHDVKGKIKRGVRSAWDKTKQGGNWLKRQWEEADFGDGKGKAKYFADGGMAGLSHVSGMLPNPLPMSTIQSMSIGGVADEVSYIDNRIYNLEELVENMNEEDRPNIYATINKLKKEKETLLTKGSVDKTKKSFFGLFAEGGEIKLPKNNSKVHFIDDQNREYDGVFIDSEGEDKIYYIGFEGKGDFRYSFEVIDWKYIDGGNNYNDAHEKHEKSETAEEENSEHQYDVYDNKMMLENQAKEVEHHSKELNNQVEVTKKVPAWVIAKMERASTDLSDITHYLDGENKMEEGGKVGDVKYEVLPYLNKFIIAKVTYKQHEDYTYPSKEFIYAFNGIKFLEFDDIKSAEKYIDNIEPKYPFGIPKANVGMLLLASELMKSQPQQQSQPQVVYYIPKPIEETEEHAGIKQNIPEMANGGELDNTELNDFCITNLIELANEIQPVRYFLTDRFKETDIESKNYKGRLIIVFKELASINVIEAITKFIERAEDCHNILEQSVNVSGSEPRSVSINILSDRFSDREFNRGGKLYDYPPKKINIDKTKKIKTHLGDYNLVLITNDFIYFVNANQKDENAKTIIYSKNGELLSDNIHATNDLFKTLETQDNFEFIHPEMEIYRKENLKTN